MSRSDRIMVAAGGAAVILALAAGWLALAPAVAEPPDLAAGAADAADTDRHRAGI